MVRPKLDCFFEVVFCMGTPVVALATKLESVLSADLITAILRVVKVAILEDFTGVYWSDVADLFACSVVDEEAMSGQVLVSQATTGTLALGVIDDSYRLVVGISMSNKIGIKICCVSCLSLGEIYRLAP